MSSPRVAILYYSTWGHIRTMALSIQKGIESAGGSADLYQIDETLSQEILDQMHAPPKSDDPVATTDTLTQYDAFLFGIPTRYGNFPAQWKSFWDATGGLWANGSLYGKHVGVFVSTGTPGGGQESTALNALSTFVHHGMVFVPLGYAKTFEKQTNLEEVHGGSAWGAGTFAGATGERQPTNLEKEIAEIQGSEFYKYLGSSKGGKSGESASKPAAAEESSSSKAGGDSGEASTSAAAAAATSSSSKAEDTTKKATEEAKSTAKDAADSATKKSGGESEPTPAQKKRFSQRLKSIFN